MAKPTGKITLAPQPIKFGPQWHVVGTYPDGQQEHITGFKTEADALDWIAQRFRDLAGKTTGSVIGQKYSKPSARGLRRGRQLRRPGGNCRASVWI
jgi:hypothetical protein